MSISSRPDLSTELKVTGNRTTYQPLQMSDATVYDLARHYYTLDEIAERFGVSKNTVLDLHSEAFQAGKDNAMRKPRMLLNKIFDDFSHADINFARKDTPTDTLLAAIKLHAQKYEGLGSKQTIVHEGKGYDGVESAPEIIEKPVE